MRRISGLPTVLQEHVAGVKSGTTAGGRIGRRDVLLGCLAATLPFRALAQPAPRKIGYVSWFSPRAAGQVEQFRSGMRDLGYGEGRDFTLEAHFTDGDRSRTREVARQLVRDKADVLVVVASPAIAIVREEAGPIPIVMASVADPITAGFAQSLSRPGGNLTGRTMFGPDLAGKRIDLLREIRPELRTVAFLGSSSNVLTPRFVREMQAQTDRSGLKLLVKLVEGPHAVDAGLFEAMRREGADVVVVHPIFNTYQGTIVPLGNAAGLPVVADHAEFAQAGALLTYGIDLDANIRRAAYFVDRIFKGASPADLPIEQPTETKLAVNLVAARRFGWTIPPAVIARADAVIE
ncbi:MAG TPA: ABC transporter substrate-binding protein [Beijerinckiaceae bacterium]|nr:ABC transporter substrate-binding protein [Beijerinckiaceae bacterium]